MQRPLGDAVEPAGQLHFFVLASQLSDEQSLDCLQEKPFEHFQQVLPPLWVAAARIARRTAGPRER
jgi:hypothetical protein